MQERLGNTRAALEAYRKSLEIRETLAKADPKNTLAQRDLGTIHENLGNVQVRLGDPRAALEAYCKRLAIAKGLAKADPGNVKTQRELSASHNKVGYEQWRQGNTSAALESYRNSVKVAEALLKVHPGNAPAQHELAISYNNLAWSLATCPEQDLRDANQAVHFAEKALQLTPGSGDYHSTLGVCHYRNRDWKNAIVFLEKSLQLDKGNTGTDYFFLAMARHQLGNKEQAKSRFNQAIAWMDKNQPNDPELRRFRAEAAALLGITEAPRPKEAPGGRR